jgi:hypothetical protein
MSDFIVPVPGQCLLGAQSTVRAGPLFLDELHHGHEPHHGLVVKDDIFVPSTSEPASAQYLSNFCRWMSSFDALHVAQVAQVMSGFTPLRADHTSNLAQTMIWASRLAQAMSGSRASDSPMAQVEESTDVAPVSLWHEREQA